MSPTLISMVITGHCVNKLAKLKFTIFPKVLLFLCFFFLLHAPSLGTGPHNARLANKPRHIVLALGHYVIQSFISWCFTSLSVQTENMTPSHKELDCVNVLEQTCNMEQVLYYWRMFFVSRPKFLSLVLFSDWTFR